MRRFPSCSDDETSRQRRDRRARHGTGATAYASFTLTPPYQTNLHASRHRTDRRRQWFDVPLTETVFVGSDSSRSTRSHRRCTTLHRHTRRTSVCDLAESDLVGSRGGRSPHGFARPARVGSSRRRDCSRHRSCRRWATTSARTVIWRPTATGYDQRVEDELWPASVAGRRLRVVRRSARWRGHRYGVGSSRWPRAAHCSCARTSGMSSAVSTSDSRCPEGVGQPRPLPAGVRRQSGSARGAAR